MSRVIVFHENCADGITALWCALQKWPDAEPYPGRHSEPPDLERLRDKDVVVVDFSWKRSAMEAVRDIAASLLVLDHHASAAKELKDFDPGPGPGSRVVFDMERSGAGLAWDELIGGERPWLVDYVEDRDLWRFALPGSKEVHAACNSYPLTLEQRAWLMLRSCEGLVEEGEAILRYHDKLVESAAEHALRETIAGHDVPSIAVPTIEIVSDLGHRLAQGEPFAACYVDRPDGSRSYHLRSSPEGGLDVSKIAASLGGGGHPRAAGFTRPAPAAAPAGDDHG